MLSILLTVLKITGITILIILVFILFMLLLILFVPVRYCGKGSYHDSLFVVKLRASWLLHLFSLRGEYQNGQELHIRLKLLGITVYDNLKKRSIKTKHKKVKSTKNKIEDSGEIQAASLGESVLEDDNAEDAAVEFDHSDHSGGESGAKEKAAVTDELQNEPLNHKKKRAGIVQKIKIFFINFVNFFKNLKFTFDKVCDTMVKIKDNIKYYLEILQLDSTKMAFATGQKQLGRVLRKLSPRKYRISLHLGFDDPAVMGEILAVWGMLYPFHLGNIDIQPEFDQTVLETDISFEGHVSVFVFARAACVLFLDKDIKGLLKQLRRSEN